MTISMIIGMDKSASTNIRWEGFSDEELLELDSMMSAAEESYELTPRAWELVGEVDRETTRRRALAERSSKTLSMQDVEEWLKRRRIGGTSYPPDPASLMLWDLIEDLESRPSLDPEHDRRDG